MGDRPRRFAIHTFELLIDGHFLSRAWCEFPGIERGIRRTGPFTPGVAAGSGAETILPASSGRTVESACGKRSAATNRESGVNSRSRTSCPACHRSAGRIRRKAWPATNERLAQVHSANNNAGPRRFRAANSELIYELRHGVVKIITAFEVRPPNMLESALVTLPIANVQPFAI